MTFEIYPSYSEFSRLAKQATVIPVWGALLADLDTPVSAFLKLDDGKSSFLLESVEGEEKLARFSFLGSRPRLVVIGQQGRLVLRPGPEHDGISRRLPTSGDPLTQIEELMHGFRAAPMPGLPRFTGGLVGYVGYNTVRSIERIPPFARDPLQVPDLALMLTESMIIFDHAQHKMLVVVNAFLDGTSPRRAYQQAVTQVQALARQVSIRTPRAALRPLPRRTEAAIRSNLSRAQFADMVGRAKRYIRDGEIIQTVLSQRFERRCRASPLDVYRALRSLNPSPYMYLLRFGSLSLVGSSPEMLVRCEEGRIQTRPIAGTRPRGATEQQEARLIHQLIRSPKERAEHLMLVDLGRNDLGRVAQIGSVATPELMVIEKYSHVMHLVSGVHARLRPGRNAFDVLRATFPAGTVTGAPKVRAMEIIAELERDDRGPYAGAVGYFSFSGNLDTCITIRTIVLQGQRASVQAGAGIVADSNAAREYQETVNKAKGCLQAIALAEAGLAQ